MDNEYRFHPFETSNPAQDSNETNSNVLRGFLSAEDILLSALIGHFNKKYQTIIKEEQMFKTSQIFNQF